MTRARALAFLPLALGVHAGCRQPELLPPPASLPAARARAGGQGDPARGGLEVTVKRVVDGDTLLVTGPRGTELVRLTGLDAPETGEGRTPRECFGPEARRWLSEQAPRGSRLRLVFDLGERDRFGRLLAYAYRADGTFLNAALIEHGYARTMTIRPNVRHAKDLHALQRRARSENRGLWAACRGRQ